MKVAVLGSSGFIASRLVSILKKEEIDIVEINHAMIDLEYPEKFDYSILSGVDFVVIAAAISSPDKCEKEFDYCWTVNVTGTIFFIKKALEMNCKVIFFSSDAVYGNISGKIYDENSETLPKTAYGKMKKAVEAEFFSDDAFKAIRLSYVVSRFDKFTSYCLNCVRENKAAEIFHPFYRSCITLSDVLKLVLYLLKNWDSTNFNVINACGNELISRVRIVDELNRFCDEKIDYRIVEPQDSFYLNRPMITQMKSLYLSKLPFFENESFSKKIEKELGVVYGC